MDKVNDYTLSKHSYGFCYHYAMRYNELKKELRDLETVYTKPNYDSPPKASGKISNNTERLAIQRYNISTKIEIIEKAAYETDPYLYKWILIGVTTDYGYTYLKNVKDIPCSRNTYYKYVKKFYWVLNGMLDKVRYDG